MTSQEIVDSFWTHYIMLEKEFMATTGFVKIDVDNYLTYSDAYVKLLLQIGSEVDVVAKETCKLIDSAFSEETMDKYRLTLSSDPEFISASVELLNYGITLSPWNDAESISAGNPALIWWKAYNKVKHERMNAVTIDGVSKESFKFANLKNTLTALGALYHLILHAYYLALKKEGKNTEVPLPGSRLYKMNGLVWSNVVFPFDTSFYIDNGCLMMKTSSIPY